MVFGLGRSADNQPAPKRWDLTQKILPEDGILAMALDSMLRLADTIGNKSVDVLSGVLGGGNVFGSVSDTSIGASYTPQPAIVRAPEITPARGAHDVDPAELFTFSAPTFNAIPMAARATGQGASV